MPRHGTCPDDASLKRLLDETLEASEQSELSAHLETCNDCRHRLENFVAGGDSWVAARGLCHAQKDDTQPGLRRVMAELESEISSADTLGSAHVEIKDVLAFLGPPQQPGNLGRLGHYEILEVIGHGGMSVVLKAFDEKLNRVVAIKVLAPQLAASRNSHKRFTREAMATAAVFHENVVAIHAVEDDGPLPYFVMHHVAGVSLQQRLDRTGALEVKDIVRIGMQIAAGLAAAHMQGLVHRDIKPANILLENGIERVKITDFGLARAADDASVTRSGFIIGTPLYMAPEQARGEAIDHRSDLFSLGSVLYALCTGRPPFRASSTVAVLKRVCDDTPRPIRELNPDIPDWLCADIERLQAKDRAQRFQSAAEVAERFGRHLSRIQQGDPAPPSTRGKSKRFRLLAAAVAFLVLVVIGFIAWPWSNDSGPGPAAVQKPLGIEEMSRLPSPLDSLNPQDVPATLRAIAAWNDPAEVPEGLVAILCDERFLMPDNSRASWPVQSPDGKTLAVPCGTSIALFDAKTGMPREHIRGQRGVLFRIALSPDGKHLAACTWGPDHDITIWDVSTRKPVRVLKGHTAIVVRVTYSTDGKRLASASDDRTTRIWDAETGVEKLQLDRHEGNVAGAVFSHDSRWIYTAGTDGTLRLSDASMGKEKKAVRVEGLTFNSIELSQDGKLIAAGNDTQGRVWDAETLEERATLDRPCGWLAFAPDGRTLMTARHDHQTGSTHIVYRWDLRTEKWQPPLSLLSRGGFAVYHLSEDGNTIWSMSALPPDARLIAHDAESGQRLFAPTGHTGPVYSVAVHPDGKTIASGGADNAVRIWDAATRKQLRLLRVHSAPILSVSFSADGKYLAAGAQDGRIGLWDSATWERIRLTPDHTRGPARIVFSPDSRTVAAGSENGNVNTWDVSTGEARAPLLGRTGAPLVRAIAYQADGQLIATGNQEGTIDVRELNTGRLVQHFRLEAPVTDIAFAHGSQTLAAMFDSPDAILSQWDLSSSEQTVRPGHMAPHGSLAIHPAGHLAATGASDGTVRLWDLTPHSRNSRRFGPGPFGSAVHQVAFTPEGRYLATANANSAVYLIRLATAGEIPLARGSPTP
jgi:WD40 repeat protein/serine/threonine protein kinase